ncbi:MAG: PAC2 family protein [Chloroflexota bacterium]
MQDDKMREMEVIRWYKKPDVRECSLLAAWPGIGSVSLIIANYVRDELGADEIGELVPEAFFDPVGVDVKKNVIGLARVPQSRFYYWPNPLGKDLLLFISEAQPEMKAYELANVLLDLAPEWNITRVYTCAAAMTQIHYAEESKVWGVATSGRLLTALKRCGAVMQGDLYIAGLNGLLLGAAKERGIRGVCLLGEVPAYSTRVPNPKAALAVLRVLARVLRLDIGLDRLAELTKETEEETKKLAGEAIGEYIRTFTKPLFPEDEDKN